jgi:hypothetical protein
MNKTFRLGMTLCGALTMAVALSQASLAQTKPSAAQQLQKANEGEKQRGQVYDGRRDQGTVRANTASKPSPVGQPVQSTANNPGYKPAAPRMRTVEPPAPARNLNPTGDKAVQKGIDTYKKPNTR